jgi:hypothetical protein
LALVVGHGFGELEIAVVVEYGIEGNRGASGSLKVSEVFEATSSPAGKLLRAGKVFAAVSEGLGLLLELAKLCRATAICKV